MDVFSKKYGRFFRKVPTFLFYCRKSGVKKVVQRAQKQYFLNRFSIESQAVTSILIKQYIAK